VVVGDEQVGRVQLRRAVPLGDHALVRLRLRRLQARARARASNVGTRELRRDDLVCAQEAEEQVPDPLLRVEAAVGLLERLQYRRGTGAADGARGTAPPRLG